MKREETKQSGESEKVLRPMILSIFYNCENRFVGYGYIISRDEDLVEMICMAGKELRLASTDQIGSKRYKKVGLAPFNVPVFVEVENGK